MKKNERGITLIALVVTIVVLLILAGVSISMLTGENGIINQAKNSKDATEQARVEELVNLAVGSLVARYKGDTSQITPQMVAEEINNTEKRTDVYTDDETFPATIKFPEEGREAIAELNSSTTTGSYDGIYSEPGLEGQIAPVNIFNYEIIDNAEIGATEWDNLPTKEVRITGLKPKYCNNEGKYDSNTNESITDTNYEIILDDGSKISETLVIPYQVEGQYVNNRTAEEMYKVTEVNLGVYFDDDGSGWYGLPKVKTIIYPNTVKSILGNRYQSTETITKIILSQNLEKIGGYAFYGYDFTDIIIPDGVISIGNDAFGSCENLTKITIPDSVVSIGEKAFIYCDNLKEIRILRNENSSTISGEPWGASANITYKNKAYLEFTKNYLDDKNQEELEELILKTAGYTGTIEEFKQEVNLEQEATQEGMNYIEYLKYILTNAESSWVYVEYMVLEQGGEGKTVQELEKLFVEKIGYPGTFEQLLEESNMTRGDFENMIKEQGFRSEEDYLKVQIYVNKAF